MESWLVPEGQPEARAAVDVAPRSAVPRWSSSLWAVGVGIWYLWGDGYFESHIERSCSTAVYTFIITTDYNLSTPWWSS